MTTILFVLYFRLVKGLERIPQGGVETLEIVPSNNMRHIKRGKFIENTKKLEALKLEVVSELALLTPQIHSLDFPKMMLETHSKTKSLF